MISMITQQRANNCINRTPLTRTTLNLGITVQSTCTVNLFIKHPANAVEVELGQTLVESFSWLIQRNINQEVIVVYFIYKSNPSYKVELSNLYESYIICMTHTFVGLLKTVTAERTAWNFNQKLIQTLVFSSYQRTNQNNSGYEKYHGSILLTAVEFWVQCNSGQIRSFLKAHYIWLSKYCWHVVNLVKLWSISNSHLSNGSLMRPQVHFFHISNSVSESPIIFTWWLCIWI